MINLEEYAGKLGLDRTKTRAGLRAVIDFFGQKYGELKLIGRARSGPFDLNYGRSVLYRIADRNTTRFIPDSLKTRTRKIPGGRPIADYVNPLIVTERKFRTAQLLQGLQKYGRAVLGPKDQPRTVGPHIGRAVG